MNIIGPIKRSSSRCLSKKEEFAEAYVRNHTFFYGEPPTEDDINRAWNAGKMKRVKRRRQSKMTKQEFTEAFYRNSYVMFGESPNEEEANKAWDILEFERLVKLKPKAERSAFRYRWMELMTSLYSPAAIEERRMQRQMDLNKGTPTTSGAALGAMNMPSDLIAVVRF